MQYYISPPLWLANKLPLITSSRRITKTTCNQPVSGRYTTYGNQTSASKSVFNLTNTYLSTIYLHEWSILLLVRNRYRRVLQWTISCSCDWRRAIAWWLPLSLPSLGAVLGFLHVCFILGGYCVSIQQGSFKFLRFLKF